MHKKNSPPTVICFAGLDPSGGAGLHADIEAIASCGGHALPIATCLTVQNTSSAISTSAVNATLIYQQFSALNKEIDISACKIGVIPNKEVALCISSILQQLSDIPIVYDPVFSPSVGSQFANDETVDSIKTSILPYVSVLTPNINEVDVLLNYHMDDFEQAKKLCEFGIDHILVTGADSTTSDVNNALIGKHGVHQIFTYPRLAKRYHGSGCTLSSSLAIYLAQHIEIHTACEMAQEYTYQSLQNAYEIGKGQLIPSRVRSWH